MAIKNYTTQVSASKTVGEIQEILVKAKAKSISIDYTDGFPEAVRFSLEVGGQDAWFRLPCNPQGVLKTLTRDNAERRYRNIEHARRVAWRIIKDWMDAQLAIIDAGQAKAAEVFFPYVIDKSGETFYQQFENRQLMLTSGDQQ